MKKDKIENPFKLLRKAHYRGSKLTLLQKLFNLSKRRGYAFAKQDYLAKELEVTEREIQYLLSELKADGVIAINKVAGHNKYFLNFEKLREQAAQPKPLPKKKEPKSKSSELHCGHSDATRRIIHACDSCVEHLSAEDTKLISSSTRKKLRVPPAKNFVSHTKETSSSTRKKLRVLEAENDSQDSENNGIADAAEPPTRDFTRDFTREVTMDMTTILAPQDKAVKHNQTSVLAPLAAEERNDSASSSGDNSNEESVRQRLAHGLKEQYGIVIGSRPSSQNTRQSSAVAAGQAEASSMEPSNPENVSLDFGPYNREAIEARMKAIFQRGQPTATA